MNFPARSRLPTYSQNAKKAELTAAYTALAVELSSPGIRIVGNYSLQRQIAEGSFGTVHLATHRLSNTLVAIKQLPRTDLRLTLLTREIHHHRRLRHENVLELLEIIATETSVYLVTELCTGGELFDYLVEKSSLSTRETRRIFGQLILGVAYLHSQGVVHRDLKLENILLDDKLNVKIADFGFGRESERGRWMETWVGTLGYCAPEVLEAKRYLGEEVDIWSLGVILYTMLTGSLPFDDDDEAVMRAKILKVEYQMPSWLDEDAAHLINGILQLDPLRRFSLKAIIAHPFFTRIRTKSPTPHRSTASPATASASVSFPIGIPEEGDAYKFLGPIDSVALGLSSVTLSAISDSEQGLSATNLTSATSEHDQARSTVYDHIANGNLRHSTPPSQLATGFLAPTLQRNLSTSSASSSHSLFRSPSRTKRRSVSSIISEKFHPTPEMDNNLTESEPLDYLSLMAASPSVVFTATEEIALLEKLRSVGIDIDQMRHSVETNACDSIGALWWILRKKLEIKSVVEAEISKEFVKEMDLRHFTFPVMQSTPIASPNPSPKSSPRVSLLRPRSVTTSGRMITPPISPTSSPSSKSTPLEVTKPRSNSVSILSRASIAIGNLKKDSSLFGGGRRISDPKEMDVLPFASTASFAPPTTSPKRDPLPPLTRAPSISPDLPSPETSGNAAAAKKGSLFTSVKEWFGPNEKKKRKRPLAPPRRPRSTLDAHPVHIRPSFPSRRSSTGSNIVSSTSRRNSFNSLQGGGTTKKEFLRVRRRSDSSRASMSEAEYVPPSLAGVAGGGGIPSRSNSLSSLSRLSKLSPPFTTTSAGAMMMGSATKASSISSIESKIRSQPGTTTVVIRRPGRRSRSKTRSIPTRESSNSSIGGSLTSADEGNKEAIIEEEDEMDIETSNGKMKMGNMLRGKKGESTIFTAHKAQHIFGAPPHSRPHRATSRNVFAIEKDEEWIDEETEFSGGLGQSSKIIDCVPIETNKFSTRLAQTQASVKGVGRGLRSTVVIEEEDEE